MYLTSMSMFDSYFGVPEQCPRTITKERKIGVPEQLWPHWVQDASATGDVNILDALATLILVVFTDAIRMISPSYVEKYVL